MRGDRLLSILLLLQSQGQMTAKELAERLEVSERTIYRDMEALSRSGIPVVAERGSNGGWSLLEDYKTELTGLKESEIRALFVSPPAQLLEDLGLNGFSEEARTKLIASLPSAHRAMAADVWNRIHVDTSSWRAQQEEIKSFESLKQAIWKDRKLIISYERADGTQVERIVGPLGLVAKGNRWYFVALNEDGEVRNYRASRIHNVEVLNDIFTRPKHFNLAFYWKASTQDFIGKLPTYEVKAEVTPSILPRLKFTGRFARFSEMGSKSHKGWIPVKLIFDTEEEAKGYLLGFADQIRVLEPKGLRDKIIKMAESTIAFYKSIH